jgi:hypothetical protein
VTAAGDRTAVTGGSAALQALAVIDAGLLIASGAIHLHLWDIAYQHVPTLGPLFLVQAASALVLALTILVTRHLLAVVAGLALVAGTIIGFILVRTTGLFGFHLTFSSGEANAVLIVEAAAVVALSATGALLIRRGALATLPGWLRPGRS